MGAGAEREKTSLRLGGSLATASDPPVEDAPWAVLAWLDGEQPAHDRIEQLLGDRPLMSWVNGVEVYYRVERDHGRSEADDVLAGLRRTFEWDLPGTALMIETARLKASTPIALGDCFAVATAFTRSLTLLTGDPEILGRDLPCPVEDLRAR